MAREPSYHEIEHEPDTIPPPPGSLAGGAERTTPTDSYILDRVNGAARMSKKALGLAEQAHAGIARLEQAFGQSPDPAQGKAGSGMLGVLSELTAQVRGEREERAKSRQALANIGKGVAFTLGLVATALGILKGILRW